MCCSCSQDYDGRMIEAVFRATEPPCEPCSGQGVSRPSLQSSCAAVSGRDLTLPVRHLCRSHFIVPSIAFVFSDVSKTGVTPLGCKPFMLIFRPSSEWVEWVGSWWRYRRRPLECLLAKREVVWVALSAGPIEQTFPLTGKYTTVHP